MGNVAAAEPKPLVTFKKLPDDSLLDTINIPEKEHNRAKTNTRWLIALGVCFLLMLPFVIYTLANSDLRRFGGVDSCGNICGVKNEPVEGIECSGKDMTGLPYEKSGICVSQPCNFDDSDCVDRIGRNSINTDILDKTSFFKGTEWQMVVALIVCLFVALGMLFLFRYAVDMLVWGILITCFVLLGLVIGACWYFYLTLKEESSTNSKEAQGIRELKTSFLVYGIGLSVVGLIYLVLVIWMRRKIELVIRLLKEATKAVFTMPGLIGIPVLALFAHIVVSVPFATSFVFMASASKLKKNTDPDTKSTYAYTYQMDPIMMFSILYALFMWFWISQVIVGVNYMTISGAVSKWYFTRNKGYLEAPISTSTRVTFKFHLGTAAFGGFIIAVVSFIKTLVRALLSNDRIKPFVECCIQGVEDLLKVLSKNAYIITAMHGEPFLTSGRRATRLIFHNLKSVIAINWIGDFVLGVTQFLIVLISMLFFALLMYIFPPASNTSSFFAYLIVFIVAAIIAGVTFGVFETTVDTLFICYCEDSMMNDGMARPYFMSRELMEFIEGSKKVYGKKDVTRV